jgi:hypothetical protein
MGWLILLGLMAALMIWMTGDATRTQRSGSGCLYILTVVFLLLVALIVWGGVSVGSIP